MRSMTWIRAARGAAVTTAALAAALGWTGALSAQVRPAPAPAPRAERDAARECRCLDESGQERERCFCFVMPEQFGTSMIGFGRRAVLGVNVRHDQPTRYDEQGVRLYGVDEDAPAGEAGLEEGDIVVAVDGRSLTQPLADERAEDRLSDDDSRPVQRLLALLGDRDPGDTVRVEYLRDGERRTATIELEQPRLLRAGPAAFGFGPRGPMGDMRELRMFGPEAPGVTRAFRMGEECPADGEAGDRDRVFVAIGRSCVGGVELLEMRAGLADYFGAGDGGVLVADARDDNPLGLRAGDVLVAVGGRAVRGVDQALRMLRSYDDDEEIDLRVLRRQQTVDLRGRVR